MTAPMKAHTMNKRRMRPVTPATNADLGTMKLAPRTTARHGFRLEPMTTPQVSAMKIVDPANQLRLTGGPGSRGKKTSKTRVSPVITPPAIRQRINHGTRRRASFAQVQMTSAFTMPQPAPKARITGSPYINKKL